MDFRRLFFIAFSLAILPLFFSCTSYGNVYGSQIDLKNDFWYLECDADSSVLDAEIASADFKHLTDLKPCNLMRIVGKKGAYLWLKCDFEIPEELRDCDVALVIGYLRFASKVWINGAYAGSYGEFPPYERSALFVSHFYPFSRALLNQSGKNTILIKVWAHGKSSLSDQVFIAKWDEAFKISESITFNHAKVYMLFVGGMLVSFCLYFLLYFSHREDKNYLPFALISLFTMIFLSTFYAPEVPWYNSWGVPYLLFIKIALCCSFYGMMWFITSFILDYIAVKPCKQRNIARYALLSSSVLPTIFAPSYNALMAICPLMLIITIADLGFALWEFFRALFDKIRRKSAVFLISGFAPVLLSIALDLFVRNVLKNTDYPYFALFGLQASLTVFIFVLTTKYSRLSRQNAHLTAELEKEVEVKTQSLENEIAREKIDLEMASIVQQKFFPYPKSKFKGWDLAICYRPCAKVSGDLYDYYSYGENLNGLALFDVSGHGIAASLITMLSKNIIFRAFTRSTYSSDSVSTALFRINREIIETKGDIENYLTGLLFHFNNFATSGDCIVEMANAGHPNPILFCAATGEIKELVHDEEQLQYGAIGIKGIDVSFPQINFMMSEDDILVCFTDGLTEAMNSNRELYGKERVKKIIAEYHDKPSAELLDALVKNMDEFVAGTPQDDDLTVIILKRENPNDDEQKKFLLDDLYARA